MPVKDLSQNMLIRFVQMLGENKTYTEISKALSVPEMTIAELAENIENKELNRLVNIRVLDSSGWDNMYKNAISAEDVYAELGITQEDIDNADDVEFEVTPL